VAVAVEVFVRHKDVHEDFAHERCVVVAGIVLHDDALQLRQALLDAGVLVVVLLLDASERLLRQMALEQGLDVGMDMGVLEGHVSFHLLRVLVVESEDKHGEAVAAGEVDGLEQLAADARQSEIDEVAVGVLQIGDEGRYVHLLDHLADACMGRVLDVVDDGEERADIHSGGTAGGTHRLVAEAEFNAEAADDLQYAVVIADDIAHGVCFVVFLVHLLY